MVGEQADAGRLAVLDRPAQQVAEQLLGGVERLRAQPSPPHATVAAAEAVLEEQLEVVVVGAEHPVVQRLAVVRLGAASSRARASAATPGAAAGAPAHPRLRRTRR